VTADIRKCEVCSTTAPVVVTSLPGLPISVARCVECLAADAIPLYMAVGTTVAIGGLENAADWWRETIASTLEHLGVTQEVFDEAVRVADEMWSAQLAQS
jgi:hypothetical protein